MDVKAVADGDTVTVYVSATDPRESASVPGELQVLAVQREEARSVRNYAKADAIHKKIIDAGYRLVIIFIFIFLISVGYNYHSKKLAFD